MIPSFFGCDSASSVVMINNSLCYKQTQFKVTNLSVHRNSHELDNNNDSAFLPKNYTPAAAADSDDGNSQNGRKAFGLDNYT
jgi:hypothetical protein